MEMKKEIGMLYPLVSIDEWLEKHPALDEDLSFDGCGKCNDRANWIPFAFKKDRFGVQCKHCGSGTWYTYNTELFDSLSSAIGDDSE